MTFGGNENSRHFLEKKKNYVDKFIHTHTHQELNETFVFIFIVTLLINSLMEIK